MIPRLEDKRKAIKLREKGFTYGEIRSLIPELPKSTLSVWMRNINLSNEALRRLRQKMNEGIERGRFRAIIVNIRKRKQRDKEVQKLARLEFEKYKGEPFFNFGIALYWAEGSKKFRRFQFMNSDPRLVKIMMRWVEKYLKIPKNELKLRIYIHKLYKNEGCEGFWEKITSIPKSSFLKTIYKPNKHQVKKNPDYKGCIRIEAPKVISWVKTMEWQNCFTKSMRL